MNDAQDVAVEVVAGVIRDAAGRTLLARRTRGRDLAGLWEFPGGKREPGEAAVDALARELREELDIELLRSRPLIRVPFRYPHKRIVLDVYRVDAFAGRPRGCEGQALAWAPASSLAQYPMPAADRPVLAAIREPAALAITPPPTGAIDDFVAAALRVADSGVRLLQLRAPSLDATDYRELAANLLEPLAARGCELLVNADIELAERLGCGLHLRSAQLAQLARRPLAPSRRLTAACHDHAELRAAEALGVDAALLGPVCATATHPDRRPIGWDGFAALRECSDLPMYALGGLSPADLPQARLHGAQGIAAIRGFWPDDPTG